MYSSQKHKRLSEHGILKLCIKYYLSDYSNVVFLTSIVLMGTFIRRMFDYSSKNTKMNLSKSDNIYGDIRYIFVLTIVSASITCLGDFIIKKYGLQFQSNISSKALHHILTTESAGKIDLTSGKTQFAVGEGSKGMTKLFRYLFIDIVTKISYFIVDFSLFYSKLSAKYLLIAIFVSIFCVFLHINGAILAMKCKRQSNEAKGMLDKNIYEDILNYEIIKSYQTEEKQITLYNSKLKPWREADIYHQKVVVGLSFIHDLIFCLLSLGFALMLRYEGISEGENYRDSYDCILNLERTIENVSKFYRKYKESIVTSSLILYYLEEIDGFKSGTSTYSEFKDKIVFNSVSYSYNDVLVLNKIGFELLKGDKKCIYGKNGAGKSTIFRLLMRLCEPDFGHITLDGININELIIQNYRRLITYVPQETSLFDDTIMYNLSYGNDRATERVLEECKKMEIHKDIMKLENGYNTVVGERGVNINGGLRQKIFYIRAILTDAPIFIFDEPTNNLDEPSANYLIELILGDRFLDKTVLVICHDYEMVKKFPKILHFKNGVIEEEQNY